MKKIDIDQFADDNFDKIMNTTLVVCAALIVICVVASVVANVVRGFLKSPGSWTVALIFIGLAVALYHFAVKDYKGEK